jgi:hypothetical protein
VIHLDEPPFSNANGNRKQLILSLVAEHESEPPNEIRLPISRKEVGTKPIEHFKVGIFLFL